MNVGDVEVWLERQELLALHHLCPTDTRQELGLELVDTGAAVVSLARNDATILLNRAVGLGLGARVGVAEVGEVVRIFRERDISNYFIHLDRDGIDVSDEELLGLGLEKARGWRRFERDATLPEPATSSLTVRRLTLPEDAAWTEVFGRTVAQVFGFSTAAARMIQATATSDDWRLFMSFDGDTPAGTGGLFTARHPVSGTLCGWLDMGATVPAFRKRGGQAAVVAARIRAAVEMGCTRIFTETGEAVPSDAQHSYKNLLKSGFRETTLKENWRPRRTP